MNAKQERVLAQDLRALLEARGFDLLTDDGCTVLRDDYSDTYIVHFRPLGWGPKWEHPRKRFPEDRRYPATENKKADPVLEVDLDIPSRHQDGWDD